MDLTDITGSETLNSGKVSGSIVSEFKGVTPSEMLANIKTDITGKNLAWKTSGGSYEKPYKESPELKLKADIKTDKGIIDVRNFLFEAAGSRITSKTRLEAHSGSFSGSLKIDSPDISRLSDLSGIIKASGSVMAEADYSGTIEKPSFKAKVNADRLKIDDVTIGSLIIDAGLSDSGVLKISRLELKNRSSSASASGNAVIPVPVNAKENTEPAADPDKKGYQDQVISEKISDMPVDLKVSIKNFNPSFFVESPLPFAGIFDAELKAGGKTSAPVAELHAQGRNISVSGNIIGNAALDAGLSKGRLNIRNMNIQNRSSLLIIAGEAGLFKGKGFEISPDPEIKAEIKKADINIGDFFPGSEGNITASGNITGSVNDPSGSIDVKTGKLTFDKIGILSAGLRTSIKKRIISIDNFDIRPAENESIKAAGWIGTDGKFSFNLDSDEISVSAFRKALPLSDLSGKISLSATGSGTFSIPEIKGAIRFSGLGAKNQTFRDFSLGFGLSGKNFRAESAPDPEFMNIYADLGRKNFSADMDFRELDLAPFFKSAGIDELEGKTGAEISAKGSYAESDRRLSARADIRNLELDYRKKRLLSCSSFSAAFEKDVLSVIKSDIRIMKKGSLSIAGKLDLKNGHDFSIKSSLALDDAAPLVPDMLPDIEGMITADARITGNTSKPVIQGNIDIKNVALTVPETFQRLNDFNGRIVMEPGKITLERIKGMLDEGTVSLGGNIILDGFHADDIKLRMMVRNLPVRVPDTAEIVMNAGISLTGSQDSSLLSGEAVLVEGVYYKNADLSLVSLPKRPVRKKPPFWESIENPFLKNMGLDISLTKREPLVVDNNLAKLELSPDLRLTGKAASPVVSGRCKVDSGTIYYRKNEYEIKKGVIDFINPYSIEPEFDIESSAKIRKWTVTLKISGTPEKLEFDLSSNPALDDNDILSLVILGNVTKNVSASQAAKRPAAEMLGEMLASTFSDEIKSVSGLDILEAGDNQSEEEDLTRVTIGKKLSKRLAVKYSVDSRAGEISQKAIAEYKLLENILLNGFRDSNGIYGGELQYRLEFR
jgi:autotransporter translocation and assembly factor TamB